MDTGRAPDPWHGDRAAGGVLEALRADRDHPLLAQFPEGVVFSFDRDLRYLCVGGQGVADTGLAREMMEGRTVFDVFPEAVVASLEPAYRATLAGGTSVRDIVYRDRIYSQHLAPITEPDGEIVAGRGFTHDVTEARLAEAALREASERNRLIFEHAPIGKALVGLSGRFLQVNPALAELTGYSEAELLELSFHDITHPEDLDNDLGHVTRLLAGDIRSYQIEKRYLTAAGRTVWVLLSGSLVRDANGDPRYYIAQIQDITDVKRQRLALQDLTGMLAHDLRTPTAVILGFAELLDERLGSDIPEVGDYLARITASARALSDLLGNALTATTLDSGAIEATPRRVPVRGALAKAVRTVDLGAVRVDDRGVEDVAAWIDPVHLHQVLTNLLGNAVKYGGDTVRVAACSHGDRVCLQVTDNGPGVDPGFAPHLFDRFSRSATARAGPRRGSGLGLYIVRDLLATAGATIDHSSAPSGGACFTIDLPRAADDPAGHRG